MSSGEKISKDQLLAFLFKERNIEQFLQRDESSFLLPTFGEYMKDWFSDTTKSRRRLFSGQI